MPFQFHTADVFTDRVFGGNPLAIFPDASGIPEHALQSIAREFNLSETVFIYPPRDPANTRHVRIFTPARELPFAGHPTLGAAHALVALGLVPATGDDTQILLEEVVGLVPVRVRSERGIPVFAQLTAARLPEVGPPAPGRTLLAEMLSVEPADIVGGMYAPQAVSCGFPFLFVPLRDRDAVRRARIRMDVWDATLKSYWAPQVVVFSRDAEGEGIDIHARVYVPGDAIPEDPATGSAAAAMGGYLGARDTTPHGTLRWRVEQGVEIGRPSILEIEVDKRDREIAAVRVGGRSVMVMRGELTLPE